MGKHLGAAHRLSDHLWLLRGVFDSSARSRFVCDIVAETLGCGRHDVVVATDAHGKPYLSAPAQANLCFSLSHRDDMVLVGTADHAIGVDVEWADCAYLDVARDQFSQDEYRWLQSIDQTDGFARLWTAKEAVLKANGQGITLGMIEPDFSPLLRLGQAFDCAECPMDFAGQTYDVRWWTIGGDRPALAVSAILRHPLVTFSCLSFPALAPHLSSGSERGDGVL